MNDFNQQKVDLLLQYILVAAGQESGWDRELGMIHLIKYVYLADLTYSEFHNGETYTGLPWKFHHLGPWAVEAFKRIEPALQEIGATKKLIPNPRDDKDFARWSIDDDQLFEEIGDKLDLSVMGAVQRYVRQFGKDTSKLLDYVYKTRPMVRAAPGELLDFSLPESQYNDLDEPELDSEETPLTARQAKKRKSKLKALKERINGRLDNELMKVKSCSMPPRYDEVFFQGIEWLDSLVGDPSEPGEYAATISDKMWKSKARFDPDVSG